VSDESPQEQRTWLGSEAGMPPPPGWPAPPPAPGRGPRHEPRSKQRRLALILAGALALSVTLAIGASLSYFAGADAGRSTRTGPAFSSDGTTSVPSPAAGIVDINTFTRVFGHSQLAPQGAGSGMVLTSTGEVLTNNHVVQGAWKIEVQVPGGETYTASVVGVDPSHDVALLQLADASGLATITPGDATTLSVGDRVAGIGNALGRGGAPAVATGSVTALGRSITARDPNGSAEKLTGMIQINANIQPGDSGGALVDASGQVVGMVTAGSDGIQTGSGPTAGFAIPIDAALAVVNEIHTGSGDPSVVLLGERGYLGVAVRPLDQSSAAQLGVSQGALVVGIDANGPAQTAGMTAPAVITAIDGRPVTDAESLGPLLHSHVPGDSVTVTWVDASGSHSASAQLIAGPAV